MRQLSNLNALDKSMQLKIPVGHSTMKKHMYPLDDYKIHEIIETIQQRKQTK